MSSSSPTVVTWRKSDLTDPTQWPNLLANAYNLLFLDLKTALLISYPQQLRPYVTLSQDGPGQTLTITLASGISTSLSTPDLAAALYASSAATLAQLPTLQQLYSDNAQTPLSTRAMLFYMLVHGPPAVGTITLPSQGIAYVANALQWVQTQFPNFPFDH